MKIFLKKYQNRNAIITDEGLQFSYGNLLEETDRLYDIIKRKCLVFCLCENQIGSIIGYLSFLSNGVVPLMLDAKLDKDLLDNLINIYEPSYIWLSSELADKYFDEIPKFESYQYSLVQLPNNKKTELSDDLALLLTTSGSTGSPKLVRLSRENIFSNAESIAQYLSIDDNEKAITSLPMNYSYGLSIINSHLIKGATVLLTNYALMQKEFWDFLKEKQATSLSGVPYTYEMLKRLRFFRMDLPHLKTLTQAGGKLSLNLNQEFSEFCNQNNKNFFVMYGQTEATARMSYLPSSKSLEKTGSIGIAIPNGKFEIVDKQKDEASGEEFGELVYFGKNVCLGYAENKSDLTKGDEKEGILSTGDLARVDEDGFYYIVGRKKRFIKLFGNRINLDETEQLVKPICQDCACVGSDDLLVIYLTDKSKIEEVKSLVKEKLAINHRYYKVLCIDEIPKNSSGKTIYSSLNLV